MITHTVFQLTFGPRASGHPPTATVFWWKFHRVICLIFQCRMGGCVTDLLTLDTCTMATRVATDRKSVV